MIETPVVTVIILTRDETVHMLMLFGCFNGVPAQFVVVVSGSRDETVKVVEYFGVDVSTNAFDSQAQQFNGGSVLLRAFLYWEYRYIFRLGFLAGHASLVCHFLQGFWYRFLICAKLSDLKLIEPRDIDRHWLRSKAKMPIMR